MTLTRRHYIFAAILGAYFALFLWLNLLRLWGFGFDSDDFGVFQQVVWNMANGHGPTYSLMYPYQPEANWLGFHFSVLTLLVATPLYLLFPHPELFCVLHIFGLTIAAVPLYAALRALGRTERQSALWTAVFLLNPLQCYALMFSYQELSLATPVLTFGLWAVAAKRFRFLLLACAGLVLSKEHFGMAVAGFGLLWAWHHQDWKRGLRLCITGVFCFYLVVFTIMPALNSTGGHVMLNAGNYPPEMRFDRYQWLFGSVAEMWPTFSSFAFTRESMEFYALLFLPFLLLQFAGWKFLLPVAIDLAMLLLSKDSVRYPWLYYTCGIVPAFVFAACAGTMRLRFPPTLCAGVLLTISLVLTALYPFGMIRTNFWLFSDQQMVWGNGEQMERLNTFLAGQEPLTVTQEVEPLIHQRHLLYSERDSAPAQGMLVIRLNPRSFMIAHPPYFMMPPKTTEHYLGNKGWRIAYWDDPFLVLSPEPGEDAVPRAVIWQRIQELYEMQMFIQQLRMERKTR